MKPIVYLKSSQYKRRRLFAYVHFVFLSTSLQSWQEQQPADRRRNRLVAHRTSTTITSSTVKRLFHPGPTTSERTLFQQKEQKAKPRRRKQVQVIPLIQITTTAAQLLYEESKEECAELTRTLTTTRPLPVLRFI
ncbi:Hypothetical_protein [Hexamita inflata]|uniref:Hypothetical_protein n=1 Tax=Hexamita inflata TaxID=28002 RepID=A0AA86RER4_9EUKA|nr:Hypothetical protein HINF_LOCUS60401 [Hexamita inflata]